MKLSIDDLKVSSYATQMSESELTAVKGGTTPACVEVGIAVVAAAATVIAAIVSSDDEEDTKVKTVHYNGDGTVKDSTVVTTTHG